MAGDSGVQGATFLVLIGDGLERYRFGQIYQHDPYEIEPLGGKPDILIGYPDPLYEISENGEKEAESQ